MAIRNPQQAARCGHRALQWVQSKKLVIAKRRRRCGNPYSLQVARRGQDYQHNLTTKLPTYFPPRGIAAAVGY